MGNTQETILAIDVGNTSIHWSFVQNGNLLHYNRNKHTELSLLPWDEVKQNNSPVVIAGALPHINDSVQTIANDYKIRFVELDINKQKTIKNTYPTLGIDRVCNLIGAMKEFPNLKSPLIVFDYGTATTMTACDQNGNFLGGVIRTGFELELKAISSKTLSLPHVTLAREQKISKLTTTAHNTEDAILQGVIIGQLALLEHCLSIFKETHPQPKIVFTGGNAPIIMRFSKIKCDLYDQDLTVKGIYHCYMSCKDEATSPVQR